MQRFPSRSRSIQRSRRGSWPARVFVDVVETTRKTRVASKALSSARSSIILPLFLLLQHHGTKHGWRRTSPERTDSSSLTRSLPLGKNSDGSQTRCPSSQEVEQPTE